MTQNDSTTLYDEDVVVWSERQSDLLRRMAAGERVDDLVDWPNVLEEIASVGREQLHQVSSLLMQAMAHRLKAMGWPNARDVETWQADARRFALDAADRFTPSMRQRLDIDRIYRRALQVLPTRMDGQAPGPLPARCPWTLDELLTEEQPGGGDRSSARA